MFTLEKNKSKEEGKEKALEKHFVPEGKREYRKDSRKFKL